MFTWRCQIEKGYDVKVKCNSQSDWRGSCQGISEPHSWVYLCDHEDVVCLVSGPFCSVLLPWCHELNKFIVLYSSAMMLLPKSQSDIELFETLRHINLSKFKLWISVNLFQQWENWLIQFPFPILEYVPQKSENPCLFTLISSVIWTVSSCLFTLKSSMVRIFSSMNLLIKWIEAKPVDVGMQERDSDVHSFVRFMADTEVRKDRLIWEKHSRFIYMLYTMWTFRNEEFKNGESYSFILGCGKEQMAL